MKIATAIIKLTHQFIEYDIQGTFNISFIIFSNNHKIIQFIKNDTSHKKTKYNGIDNIFNIGLIVTLINQSIIHQIIYPSGSQATAIPASIHLLGLAASK
ncbi:hypothetical protein HOF65_01440 [bacterium]|nr:hypothetical protein [bacterium]